MKNHTDMTLTNREKLGILISQAITLYSLKIQEDKTLEHQSVIDFIMQNVPKEYKQELSIELIDEVFLFVSGNSMELS